MHCVGMVKAAGKADTKGQTVVGANLELRIWKSRIADEGDTAVRIQDFVKS